MPEVMPETDDSKCEWLAWNKWCLSVLPWHSGSVLVSARVRGGGGAEKEGRKEGRKGGGGGTGRVSPCLKHCPASRGAAWKPARELKDLSSGGV